MESKQLKDYLHLYLGCEISHDTGKCVGSLTSVSFHNAEIFCDYFKRDKGHKVFEGKEWGSHVILIERLKPHLRKLSSMTEEEAIIYGEIYGIKGAKEIEVKPLEDGGVHISFKAGDSAASLFPLSNYGNKPETFRYLLSRHFDIFQLIESGLAIDSSTIQVKNQIK